MGVAKRTTSQQTALLFAVFALAATACVLWYERNRANSPKSSQENGGQQAREAPVKQSSVQAQQPVAGTEEQAQQLQVKYDSMARKFAENGLDLEHTATVRAYFRIPGVNAPITSVPGGAVDSRSYKDDWPGGQLAENAVRLLVLPMDPASKLSSSGESITREVLKALTFQKDIFRNVRQNYHITVYHTSKMMYPCPDPTQPTGGVSESMPPHERPPPSEECLKQEIDLCRGLAAGCKQPTLEFSRIVFTDTGTLLMTFTDQTGSVEQLRGQFRRTFPGATKIPQSNILHVSLLRLLCLQQLDEYVIKQVDAVCSKWTKRLAGSTWQPTNLSHVCEERFSTIEGTRVEMPFS